VIAADGLGGFGTEPDALPTKRWLLTLEGALAPTLDWDGPS
jgi:methylated-DNA-[protein]-cysteine S-methyltransferase